MFPSKLIANVIKIIHYIIMFTLLLGVFLPSKYLIYYIFLWPAVYFHWYFNDNKCMLTEIESHFDTKYPNVNIHEEVRHHKYVEIFENFKKLNIYFDNIDLFTSGVYNIADDEPISTNELINLISVALGKNPHIWNVPQSLIKSLSKLGDMLSLPLNSERLYKLTETYIVSNNKIINAINKPLPKSAKEGLIKTFNSFKNNA